MTPDGASVLLRGFSFIALCQALGGALFLAWQGWQLPAARRPLRRLVMGAAVLAALLLAAQFAIEPARYAGDWSGLGDSELQHLAWASAAGRVLALRVGALLAASLCLLLGRPAARALAASGVLLGAASFALVGHTTGLGARAAGAGLISLHMVVVLAWAGALQPLRLVVRHEPAAAAARVVAAFSRLATWSVPLLPVAGVALAALLLPSVASLASTYGLLLLAKSGGLALALLLASLNRSVHGPELATGDAGAARRFESAVLFEALLLAAVLMTTAAMTGLYSPDGA
jgi:putative copper resistance protein D